MWFFFVRSVRIDDLMSIIFNAGQIDTQFVVANESPFHFVFLSSLRRFGDEQLNGKHKKQKEAATTVATIFRFTFLFTTNSS